jgi:NADH-quinone oxidoreductase subunit H
VERTFWFVAPVISMSVALMTFAVVPWGDHLTLPAGMLGLTEAYKIKLQVADINGGLLYVLAIGSLGVYGVMLAGWASNNKFALLGGLRASAQMVSYELSMGLSVVVMFMCFGSPRLGDIVAAQSGSILHWGVFQGGIVGPLAFILFWTSVFAETNRMPFDLPEGEAELVAGYHTEYSSLRFALFFMAEYAHMVVGSAVTASLFFGGYNFPFLNGEAIRAHSDLIVTAIGFLAVPVFLAFSVIAIGRRKRNFYQVIAKNDPRQKEPLVFAVIWAGAALVHLGLGGLGLSGIVGKSQLGPEIVAFLIQTNVLVVKTLIGCWIMIWVRWTIPRFRYDQLMNLGWRMMLPVAVGNVFLAGVWVIVKNKLFA